MTSPLSQIYNNLFAGERVTLAFESKGAYDSTRVALSKLHQHTKLLLELTDDSLCARFDPSSNQGTFWIGPPVTKRKYQPFTIVEVPDAEV